MSKNLSAKYYQKNNERLKKKLAKDKRQYGRERYKNFSEGEKQKLVEYRKKHCRTRKNAL